MMLPGGAFVVPMRPFVRISLALTGATVAAGCTPECPPGSSLRPNGLCYLDDDGESTDVPDEPGGGDGLPQDTGTADGGSGTGGGTGTDTGGDSAEPETWTTLPSGCAAPTTPSDDPVFRQSNFFVQGHTFAEVIDVAVDTDRGELWGAGQGGLMGIDVSDPFNPRYFTEVSPEAWRDRAYQVHLGPHPSLYGTHRDRGLVAYDRTDPASPLERTVDPTPGSAGMDDDGSWLYVAGHDGELRTYDISDPLVPTQVGSAPGLDDGWVPRVSGDFLYVADNTLGIAVFDRSDPAAPTLLGTVETAGGAQDLALSTDGSTLYAAVGGAGIEVFSLEDPQTPQSIDLIDVDYSVISVATDAGLLWAATQQDIVAVDIRTPRVPILLNTDQSEQWAMAVAAGGGRAYLGDWGYASVYGADPALSAPDANPSSNELHIDQGGGTATLRMSNLGNASSPSSARRPARNRCPWK